MVRIDDEPWLRGIHALVPSMKFDAEWYAAAVSTGLGIYSWVVDTEAGSSYVSRTSIHSLDSRGARIGPFARLKRALHRGTHAWRGACCRASGTRGDCLIIAYPVHERRLETDDELQAAAAAAAASYDCWG